MHRSRTVEKWLGIVLTLVLLFTVFPAVVSPTPAAAAATTTLTVTKYAADGTTVLSTQTLTLAQLQALPVQGDGETHYFMQGPTFLPENLWDPGETVNLKDKGAIKGTDVKDLCNLVGGAVAGDEIQIKAVDGYNERFHYEDVYNPEPAQGKFVLAWYTKNAGDTLPKLYPDGAYVPDFAEGIQLVFTPDDHVFGHQDMHDTLPEDNWHYYYDGTTQYPSCNGLSIKWINEVSVYTQPVPQWSINVTGIVTKAVDQGWFENALACHGPAATWTDGSGNVWSGLPLWYLVGLSDDTNMHGPGAFNDAVAAAGYTVEVRAVDNYAKTFASADVARNSGYIIANKVNGADLDANNYPLKLVGSAVASSGGLRVGKIASINLIGVPTIETWTLPLSGAQNYTMTQAEFESGVNCHGATTFTNEDGTYSGLPLWLLCGWVDDSVQHGPGAFNDALAAAGYQIKVSALDGYSYTFASADVARNNGIIVANKLNGADLPGGSYPLRLTGSGYPGTGWAVREISKIELLGLQASYTLTVNTVGNGSVAKVPDQTSYGAGAQVQLTATAAQGWTFVGWSGDLTGSTNPATITMNSNKTVTANFTNQAQYTLTVNTTGSGSVTKAPDWSTYPSGTPVQLTAIPQTGWGFSGWSGDLTGTTNPALINMDGNKTVTATFTETVQWSVTLSGASTYVMNQSEFESGVECHTATYADASGTWKGMPLWLLCGWVDDATQHGPGAFDDALAAAGYQVKVSASDGYSYTFNSTDVARNPNMIVANTLNDLPLGPSKYPLTLVGSAFTSGGQKVSKIAKIELLNIPAQYTLTVNVTGSGNVAKVPDQASYLSGALVQLTATPTAGYSFGGWSGDLTGSTNPATVTMDENKTITATFIQQWSLQLNGMTQYTMPQTEFETLAATYPLSCVVTNKDGSQDTYSGAALWRLVGKVDDGDAATMNSTYAALNYNISMVASDGFSKTLTSTQVLNNDTYIVANMMNGAPLPADKAPLRVVWQGTTSGGMVSKLVKLEFAIPWSIQLIGQSTSTVTNTQFATEAAANPVSWVKDASNTYSGLALWRLVAEVDDADPTTFNDALAAAGYSVKITASDGFNKSYASADIARKDDRIIANQLNGYCLTPAEFPLRFVGPGLTGGQMVSKIVKIELINLPSLSHTLTVNTVGSGTITKVPDQPTYPSGTTVQLTATPATGWSFTGWSGDLTGTTNPATITMIGDKMVTATFAPLYTLTANVTGSGSVVKVPDQPTYLAGTSVQLTVKADAGWIFGGWSGDLTGKDNPKSITMDANKTVTATFVPWNLQLIGASTNTMSIAQLETEVAANPLSWAQDASNIWSGVALWRLIAKVDDGDPATFNDAVAALGYSVKITASDGYNKTFTSADIAKNDNRIIANKLNGQPLSQTAAPGKIGPYPIRLVGQGLSSGSMVGSIVKIELIGLPTTYTINASAGINGTITPAGNVQVISGNNKTFTVTPNSHYHVADVLVDGASVGAVTSYTFTNVTANHAIAASFAIDTYTIAASAGAGGSISPSGNVTVNYGANQTFTITPKTLYKVADVLVDGASVGTITSYTFTNVTANHTIAASFTLKKLAVMTLASSLNPSRIGQSVTFTAEVKARAASSGTPTGTVTFRDGLTTIAADVPLVNGKASCTTSALKVGTHAITAVYSGDTNFDGSVSALAQVVKKAATSTTVTSSLNPSRVGQSVTFTAKVKASAAGSGTPTGTVTFRDGKKTLGVATLNSLGEATYTTSSLTRGTHSITVVYGGDSNFEGSTSSVLTQTVNR